MLVYKGNICEHWRDQFLGEIALKYFYIIIMQRQKTPKQNMFDTRKHLGLPHYYKKLTTQI